MITLDRYTIGSGNFRTVIVAIAEAKVQIIKNNTADRNFRLKGHCKHQIKVSNYENKIALNFIETALPQAIIENSKITDLIENYKKYDFKWWGKYKQLEIKVQKTLSKDVHSNFYTLFRELTACWTMKSKQKPSAYYEYDKQRFYRNNYHSFLLNHRKIVELVNQISDFCLKYKISNN